MTQNDEQRKQRRQIVLLAALLAAVVGVVTWQVVRSDPSNMTPVSRTLSNFTVEWRCLNCGNTLTDKGGQGPRKCGKCQQKQMYVSIRWACPTHGPQPVAFQYDGEENPTKVKAGNKDWAPAITQDGWNIHCPICNANMAPPAGP